MPCREKGDFDFLSSLELLVLDQTDVFLMQNWEHLTVRPSPHVCPSSAQCVLACHTLPPSLTFSPTQHVLSHLHLRPRESHDVDFSRVRLWTLNEWSKFYRQTLIISSLQTPEINSLLATYCHSINLIITAHAVVICSSFFCMPTKKALDSFLAGVPEPCQIMRAVSDVTVMTGGKVDVWGR